jgi:hypothetical protein
MNIRTSVGSVPSSSLPSDIVKIDCWWLNAAELKPLNACIKTFKDALMKL